MFFLIKLQMTRFLHPYRLILNMIYVINMQYNFIHLIYKAPIKDFNNNDIRTRN